MMTNPDYLLVYGTLRSPFDNPFAQFLRQHGQMTGEATFPGVLLNIESPGALAYPGATYQPRAATAVVGTIYDIGLHKGSILNYLDAYEGVGEAFDRPNEYVRTVIPVHRNGTIIHCWVYLYNHSIDGKSVIASGDYAGYSRNE